MATEQLMQQIPHIDYEKIVDAISFYESNGFVYKDVPWLVTHDSYFATRPQQALDIVSILGYHVASGEQSFIELLSQGDLQGKYMCVTPCYRHEERVDDLHFKSFLKAELIDTKAHEANLHALINSAVQFFSRYTCVEVIKTEESASSYDIIDQNTKIELGSYGIRTHGPLSWVYGTGVALPRLDTVLSKISRKA